VDVGQRLCLLNVDVVLFTQRCQATSATQTSLLAISLSSTPSTSFCHAILIFSSKRRRSLSPSFMVLFQLAMSSKGVMLVVMVDTSSGSQAMTILP
jgi:hypothetical protein